ncbi:MAG: hypothetical protein K8S54_04565 [Spirochaetia bacterium]|nr:hypothetical protein [Spirochaetia bacterium]
MIRLGILLLAFAGIAATPPEVSECMKRAKNDHIAAFRACKKLESEKQSACERKARTQLKSAAAACKKL